MKITGHGIIRLMRHHKVAIRTLKVRHQITLKRIREVRANGVDGFLAEEWVYLITGVWPGSSKPNGVSIPTA